MIRYCPLFSGSSGNCAYIASDKTAILLDAGHPASTICAAMDKVAVNPALLSGILITHEHSDHVKGAGVLSRKYDLPIYANAATWAAMESCVGKVAPRNIRVFETGRDFLLGDINVTPFAISHDTAEPVAFTFANRSARISHLTDLGRMTDKILDAVERSDLLLLESNHDVGMLNAGSYPAYLKRRILSNKGHLSNEAAGEAIASLFYRKCRRFILGHLSQENNTKDAALAEVRHALEMRGAPPGEAEIYVASRSGPIAMFEID